MEATNADRDRGRLHGLGRPAGAEFAHPRGDRLHRFAPPLFPMIDTTCLLDSDGDVAFPPASGFVASYGRSSAK